MNSPGATSSSSPTFKNLRSKHKHSPVELKEKMRKNYKDKVKNCRNMLFNKFRGSVEEIELRDKLTEIYKSMFSFTDENVLDEEESEVLEEIKTELVQEELEWCLQEYEMSQNVDWSLMEQDNNVICPVCQKTNLSLHNGLLKCSYCKTMVSTQKSLLEIRNMVLSSIEKHTAACNNEVQFALLPEGQESHIYLICDACMEMQSVL